MTRLAGYSYRGTHPGLKSKEDPLSDNYITNSIANAGFLGLVIGGGLALRPAGRPLFFANSCKWASRLTLGILPLSFAWPRWQRSILESNGQQVRRKKQPWVRNVNQLGEDDLALGGLIFGAIVAVHPVMRFWTTSISTWQRVLGSASVCSGILVSGVGGIVPKIREANERDAQRMKQMVMWWAENRQTVQILGKSFTVSAAVKTVSNNSSNQSLQLDVPMPSSPGGNGDPTEPIPEVRSIGKPHKAFVRPDDSYNTLPVTDYTWREGTMEETAKSLEGYVKELYGRREQQCQVANTLWSILAEKEHQYYTEYNQEAKDALRKEVESLGAIHYLAYSKINELSWMIADSTKNIRQARALGDLPHDEHGIKQKRQNLAATLQDIRTGMFKSTLARLEAAEANVRWLREQLNNEEADYQAYVLSEVGAGARRQMALEGKPYPGGLYQQPEVVRRQVLEGFKKEFPEHPQVVHLKMFQQIEADASKELERLREEHWNSDKGKK